MNTLLFKIGYVVTQQVQTMTDIMGRKFRGNVKTSGDIRINRLVAIAEFDRLMVNNGLRED